jgi:transcriptional regulator with XRE-family HTH domain
MTPAVHELLRRARTDAGLTQAALAARLGVTQPTVAAWERPGANPTLRTVERALAATGRELRLSAPERRSAVDAGLVIEHLRLSPRERLVVLAGLQRAAARLRRARVVARGA